MNVKVARLEAFQEKIHQETEKRGHHVRFVFLNILSW